MMKQELIIKKKELPEWWKIKPLKEVLILHESGTWGPESNEKEGIAVLRSTNFTKDMKLKYEDFAYREITDKKITQKKLEFNDLLLERSGGGPKQPVGRVVLFNKKEGTYLFGNFIQRLRANTDLILPKFLYYNLFAKYLNGETESMQNNTTNLRNLRYDNFINTAILVPSLPEQQKIVSKLDKQMEQIEMMKKEAEKAMESLKIMFDSYLLKIFDQGFPTKKLGDLINKIQNGVYKPAQFRTKGKKMVRMYNIENDSIVLNDNNLQEIELSDDEKTKYILDKDDILLSRVNSAELVGKCGIVKDKLVGYAFENMIIRIKVNQNRIIPDYLAFFLISQKGKKEIRGITRHAINQSSINNTDVKKLNIPLTNDLNEQLEIVHYLNQKYGVINSLQNHFKKRIESITHLTSSILNEVFGQYEIPEEV